jgi:outer membrane protein/adhesin transport system outer membrane protein
MFHATKFRFLGLFAFCAFLIPAASASAETLQQAMIRAYDNNPSLKSARAKLRAVDEQVPLAKSGARPSADFSADIGTQTTDFNGTSAEITPRQIGVTVSQPIYKGGRIDSSIDSAEKAVLAERANLVNAEQTLFLSVAQVYYDLVRDQAVMRLTKQTEGVLGKELQAARDRLKVGEATKTDMSQAASRLAGATADRIEAEGKLEISKATYEKIIGVPAGELSQNAINFTLPPTADEVIAKAQKNSPRVISAQYAMQAAEHDVDVASGALLPDISIEASGARGWDQSVASLGELSSATIMARLVMPIYRSGSDYAKTRAAKETASQKRLDVRSTMDEARENAVRAWQQLVTARATITARKKQVEASALAYEGVKQESEVGTRTILDRLDAESETLQSQVNLVQAERDQAVAMFDVKAAVGELTADNLALPVAIYDSKAHYDAVKDTWIGLQIGLTESAPVEAPKSEAEKATGETSEDGWFDGLLGMKW